MAETPIAATNKAVVFKGRKPAMPVVLKARKKAKRFMARGLVSERQMEKVGK